MATDELAPCLEESIVMQLLDQETLLPKHFVMFFGRETAKNLHSKLLLAVSMLPKKAAAETCLENMAGPVRW